MLLKVIEEHDPELAKNVISDTSLNPEELTELIDSQLRGTIVNKETEQPVKLTNSTLMAGIRTRMNQIARDQGHENIF